MGLGLGLGIICAMPSPQSSSGQAAVTVPPALQQQHPELVALILGSESMNAEERQYWINILPMMTPEQIENLRQILKNEKDQLAAIDAKYSKEVQKAAGERSLEEVERTRREKHASRSAKEQGQKDEEKAQEEQILREIEGL